MDTIEVSAGVRRPPEAVFPVLRDFTSYADYSKYLREVRRDGDGGAGTRYLLRFGWWKLSYDAHTRVTDVDEPTALDWKVTRDLDAAGRWIVDPDEGGEASTVRFLVEYDPDSVSPGIVDLPALVSIDWVVEKVVGLIEAEGRRVVERVVADLEGERREVDLTVEYR
ncbi:MAG: SRPBCC family protein [Halanaeroarchaeum sp.]